MIVIHHHTCFTFPPLPNYIEFNWLCLIGQAVVDAKSHLDGKTSR